MKNLALILAAVAAPAAFAAPITLENGNAQATFSDDLTGTEGLGYAQSSWSVDGVNQLSLQAFAVRVGLTGPATWLFDVAPTFAVATDTGFDFLDDTLVVGYSIGGLTIETRYELAGGTNGSAQSTLNEVITITNNSGADINFSFFQYADLDLGETTADSSLEILGGNTVRQRDAGGTFFGGETILTPEPTDSQVGNFADVFNAVAGGSLDGSTFAGPGDLAWAFQWDFLSIENGDSIVISKKKTIIPAPGAMALVGLGGLIAARRRRA